MVEVLWEEAKEEERGAALIGSRIRIWWDGDMVWYEGKVVGYDSATAKHQLIYDGVDTDVYIEDLESGSEQWEIERATEGGEPGAAEAKKAVGESSQSGGGATTPTGRKSKYLTMVLESISALNEKSGVSLPSIRKWIQDKHPETKEKQKASFNNLTIKAVMKLVSEGAVEKVKHSYRLSPKCVADEKASAKEEPRRKGGSTPAVLTPQAKTGRKPSGTGRKPAAPRATGGRGEAAEANRKMRATMEEVARKRNEFLSKRRAFLLPFMQASDNFFARMDKSLALGQQQQLEEEDRDKATEKPAVEAANPDLRKTEVETKRSRHPTEESHAERGGDGQAGEGGGGKGGERGALSPEERQPSPPPAPVPTPPREVNPMDDIDFKAIPADPMTVAETLVKMRVLKREDIAPGAAKVALTGQRCTEWPPLQVDPNTGVPTMEDMGTLGACIDQQGPFRNYHITWPGSRVPVADLKELSQLQVDLNYNHVYYLEKRESLAPPLPPEPVLGPHGWVYPPPPVPRIIGRTTALRLRSGEFVQHRSGFMKRTQSYAKRNNIPVDNLVTFSIINPHTQRRYNVTREFCAAPYYAAIYKRLLKDTLRKNLSLAPVVTRQAPSSARRVADATAALAAGDPSRASSHGGSSGSDGRSRDAAERPSMSAAAAVAAAAVAAAGLERSPTGAGRGGGGVGNGSRHHPRSASLSPPRRSHQLPRGPGGIDILSCPAKDPPLEGGGGAGRMHVRSVSSADVTAAVAGAEGANDAAVAAAAMLGLGAEVFAGRGGRGPAAAKESCGSSGAVRGPPGRAAGGEGGAAVAPAPAHRSDSHADKIRVEPDTARDRHHAAWAATEVTLARRENGGGVTSERRSANGGGAEAEAEAEAEALFDGREEEQLRRERAGGDGGKQEGPREVKGGAGAEVAVKEEGMNVEEPLSERKAEDEDVDMAAEDFDPSNVLKGVPAVNVPESIKATLQGYQRDGLSWMVHMYNNGMPLILGDQTGLGKTLQGIALIAHLQQLQEDTERVSGPFLIVVPSDALGTWMSEIDKFCPSLRTVRFHGSKEERSRIKETEMKDLVESEVVVTTHETFSAEGSFFKKRSVLWQLVVVDEGHRQLKNDKSQLSQKLKQVNTMCRVLLTGMPPRTDGGMNDLRELWAVLHFLVPDVFPEDTAERFEHGVDAATGACYPRRVDQANDLLSVFMLRRAKAQVKLDLPPREEVKILVKLTPAQHLVYRHLLVIQDRKLADAIRVEGQKHDGVGAGRGGDGGPMSPGRAVAGESCGEGRGDANGECREDEMAAVVKREDEHYQKLMTLLVHLRKACNHPHMLVDVERSVGETESQTVDYTVAASGKLALLDRMLPRLQAKGHRCLIFSQFASMLDILQDLCLARGYEHGRLDESTSSPQTRLDARRFNAPESKVSVLLVPTRMAGASGGLNLTAADTVILYDSHWNPQVDQQAIERAHRIGQSKPVKVFRLLCRRSVEERIVAERRRHHDCAKMDVDEWGSPDSAKGHRGRDHRDEKDAQEALAVGGEEDSMSKGELASLIHEGARAVVEPQEDGDLTDAELDALIATPSSPSTTLSGGGRESPPSSPPAGHATAPAATTAAATAIANALAVAGRFGSPTASSSGRSGGGGGGGGGKRKVGDGDKNPSRPRGLREADLRQLDGKSGGLFGGGVHGSVLGKRARKSCIVMLRDGNPGGRGRLAIVTNAPKDATAAAAAAARPGSGGSSIDGGMPKPYHRQWQSMAVCALCGEGPDRSRPLTSCGLCPRSYHGGCLEASGVDYDATAGEGVFVCPQHRCVACTKAAAGRGLLFRCQACAKAYCEDCLPGDEVEPLARNPQLEALGYLAKQAYWIRCQPCVNGELQAKLRASITGASGSMDGREGSDARQDEKTEGGVGDEAGRGGNSAEVGGEADAAGSESESESDSEPEPEPKPKPMPFAVALTLLRDHPSAKAAFLKPSGTPASSAAGGSSSSPKRPRKAGAVSADLLAKKVEAGRYRSATAFESDARQMLTQGKGPRSLSPEQKKMVAFFEQEILPKLLIKS